MTTIAMRSARDFAVSTLLIAAIACVAFSAQADAPEALPPGMAKYVVALWTPGLPLPGGGHVKKIKEPDIEKLGGRVLSTDDNRKTILLPKAAARELRKHSAVIYLQRIWMGESLDDWDERFEPGNAGFGISSHSDENIDWVRSYEYDGSGNITKVDVNGVEADDHYTYDTAGRLIRAAVGGKVETYQYDDFGNLINKAVAGSNPVSVPIDSATNRITGSEYDLAGNVIRHGFHDYEYDALNMLGRIRLSGPVLADRRMIYDADDERIGTIQVTASDSGALSRWTIRDFGGRVLREYRGENGGFGSWIWQFDYLYTGASLVAGESVEWNDPGEEFQSYGGERHYHLDHLGSVRVVTNGEGRSLSEHDYFPFGRTMTRTQQEAVDPYDSHIDPMRFAGHARDFLGVVNAENPEYLDYMHARYYDPRLGRFLSVDPGKDWDMHQPQSWNLYAYVRNNPVNNTDPTGRCTVTSGLSVICAQVAQALWEGFYNTAANSGIGNVMLGAETGDLQRMQVGQAQMTHELLTGLVVTSMMPSEGSATVSTTEQGEAWAAPRATFFGTSNGQVVPARTPAGQPINPHAAERMANPPAGRAVMTPAQADAVLAKNTIRKIDPAKATVTYHDPSAPGKPQVSVSATNGSIVTVIKNRIRDLFD